MNKLFHMISFCIFSLFVCRIAWGGEVHRSEDGDGYETCSSAEEEIDEVDDSQAVSTLDREANFLLGRVSTFGRAVRFNSRLMFS